MVSAPNEAACLHLKSFLVPITGLGRLKLSDTSQAGRLVPSNQFLQVKSLKEHENFMKRTEQIQKPEKTQLLQDRKKREPKPPDSSPGTVPPWRMKSWNCGSRDFKGFEKWMIMSCVYRSPACVDVCEVRAASEVARGARAKGATVSSSLK